MTNPPHHPGAAHATENGQAERATRRRRFSIVVPVYYNEMNLPDTVPALLEIGAGLVDFDFELVLVDDGSGDRSLEMLREYQRAHPDVIKVVKLTRNFGSMAAIQAGFAAATGDCVGMISADLQDPPELFPQMLEHWRNGRKAVFAVRADREESLSQKAFSNSFYALFRLFGIRHYPPGGFDFFVIDRQVVNEVNRINEKNTNIMSLVFWLGYDYICIPYVRRARRKGKSRWTMSKKIKLFVDSFVAFSYAPVRALSVVGLTFSVAAFLYGLVVIYNWLVNGAEVRGWASIVVLIAFTAGIQMLMLGVLGEYLWRTLDEARRRPMFVVDEVYAGRLETGQSGERLARTLVPLTDVSRSAAEAEVDVARRG
jgi:glycosyltransferase involved in cell wall biosynthesis